MKLQEGACPYRHSDAESASCVIYLIKPDMGAPKRALAAVLNASLRTQCYLQA